MLSEWHDIKATSKGKTLVDCRVKFRYKMSKSQESLAVRIPKCF